MEGGPPAVEKTVKLLNCSYFFMAVTGWLVKKGFHFSDD